VQLKNMRRWDRRAIALEIRAKALGERYRERSEDFRQRSLEFAVAVLPFVHRRLAPVKCPVKVLSTVEHVPDE
jgi:hypothetical protein